MMDSGNPTALPRPQLAQPYGLHPVWTAENRPRRRSEHEKFLSFLVIQHRALRATTFKRCALVPPRIPDAVASSLISPEIISPTTLRVALRATPHAVIPLPGGPKKMNEREWKGWRKWSP